MRIIFMGTPDFAVPTLAALHDAGHTIAAVYTQPPRPAGRGKQLQPSPVQKEAEIRGIPVRCPLTLKDLEAQADFAALEADGPTTRAEHSVLPINFACPNFVRATRDGAEGSSDAASPWSAAVAARR